jgi:hypothetical protein
MSSPELPKKPPTSPPEVCGPPAGDANLTGQDGTLDALNYLNLLKEASPVYKGFKAAKNNPCAKAIDLSASPFPTPGTLTKADAAKKLEAANHFVSSFTGDKSPDAMEDWLFGTEANGVKHTKGGDTTIHATNADGIAVSSDLSKNKVSFDAGGVHVEKDRPTGGLTYDGPAFTASDINGIKTIKSKERGSTLQWDQKNHNGVVRDANGKIAFEFHSFAEYEAIEERLKDDRYLHVLNDKHAYDQAVRAHLAEHQTKGANFRDAQQIYTDGNGNFSIITPEGLLYQYDKASKTTYLEKGDLKIRVKDGIAYAVHTDARTGYTTETEVHDFKKFGALGLQLQDGRVTQNGQTIVAANGDINLGETKLSSGQGRLTTQSDQGNVAITSLNGVSRIENANGSSLTLDKKGSIINTDPETQGAFTNFDRTTGLVQGRTKDGAKYTINGTDLKIQEASGQRTDLYDNGAVRSVDRHGKELFSMDAHGNTSVAGQYTVSAEGNVRHHGKHIGSVDNAARSIGISTWESASSDIQGSYGNLTLDNIGYLEGQLRNDYSVITDLAARVTARGNIPVANILMARANSILDAINRLDAQKTQLQYKSAQQPNAGTIVAGGNDESPRGDHSSTPLAVKNPGAPSPLHRVDATGGWLAGAPGADYARQIDQVPLGTVSMPETRKST